MGKGKFGRWSYFDRSSAGDDFMLTVYEGGNGGYSMGVGGEKIVAACDDEKTARMIAAGPEMAATLSEELSALKTWKTEKSLPGDVREGIEISISKIESALRASGSIS